MLCLKMLHNMNRAISIRVAELKAAPTAQQRECLWCGATESAIDRLNRQHPELFSN